MNARNGFLQHSLLLKIGGALVLIVGIAIFGMASSGIIAESAQGSGEATNLAGSLRMRSHQMVGLALRSRLPDQAHALEELGVVIDYFEQTLKDPRITGMLPKRAQTELLTRYQAVSVMWQTRIKPRFLALAAGGPDDGALISTEVPAFVEELNQLVKQIEGDTEARILVLRMILGAALTLTVLVGILMLYLVRNDLLLPLRDLLAVAASVGRGNLGVRTEHTGNDELGRLGQAFNLMAEDLSRMYENLEARVKEKTAELTIANRSLELLYHSIARLYNGPVLPDTYAILLRDMENALGIGHGLACMIETGGTQAHVIASTFDAHRGERYVCGQSNCAECLSNRALAMHPLKNGTRLLSLPLADVEQQYGVLQLEMPEGRELEAWQTQLLEALSRHIGTAIGTARRAEQSRRLSLLEERAALARELHDSLAQSLAYMKIQVSRLKPLVERSGAGADAGEVLAELREGLNSAYRQLRELLTTFRLRIEGDGLADALNNTVAEFSARGGIPVELELAMVGCRLTPNEEIHALQIVREALSNVVNHAGASRAEVKMVCNGDGSISASVSDDGAGLGGGAGAHHYGLTIMEERAKQLGGRVRVENLPQRGVRVTLDFVPASQSANPLLSGSTALH